MESSWLLFSELKHVQARLGTHLSEPEADTVIEDLVLTSKSRRWPREILKMSEHEYITTTVILLGDQVVKDKVRENTDSRNTTLSVAR